MRALILALFGLLPAMALSPDKLYVLHCMGCHGPQGEGIPGRVPALKGFVGYFTYLPEGRAFLIQVPGVANAPLSDEELAQVTNWLLRTFSSKELPPDFKPFTAEEVRRYRAKPLQNVSQVREALLSRLRAMGLLR